MKRPNAITAWKVVVFYAILLTYKAVSGVFTVERKIEETNIALGKDTKQSSTEGYAESSLAVDGNTSPKFNDNSCTSTKKEKKPWWRVDLGKEYEIKAVKITNRDDGMGWRLKGIFILVGNNETASITGNNVCVTKKGLLNGQTKQFPCTSFPKGKYVYVTLIQSKLNDDESTKLAKQNIAEEAMLSLCEVQVFAFKNEPNIALGKDTKQSSTNGSAESSLAVDGNASPKFNDNSCTRTNEEINPWWRVDLGQEYEIKSVKITNRDDMMGWKLRGMSILVGNSETASMTENKICVTRKGLFDGKTEEFPCTSFPKGKFVYVTLIQSKLNEDESTKLAKPYIAKEAILSLCEVQVFALIIEPNIALGKDTKQSSTDGYAESSLAVDGNASPKFNDNSCTRTNEEINPWWRVDLGQEYEIKSVKITNRDDMMGWKLRGMSILVGNSETASMTENKICVTRKALFDGKTEEFPCTSFPKGKYVYVTLIQSKLNEDESTKLAKPNIAKEAILSLCEVQVFAHKKVKNAVIGISDTNREEEPNIAPAVSGISDNNKEEEPNIAPGVSEISHTDREEEPNIAPVVSGISYTDRKKEEPNIALGKETKQSSTEGSAKSSLAVDGNTSPKFKENSCTSTNKEMNPWWRVDLGQEYEINSVKITNRGDGFGFRLRDMSILVGNSELASMTGNKVCVMEQALLDGETREFQCISFPKGKYVYVTLSRSKLNKDESTKLAKPRIAVKAILSLCEVQVFARRRVENGIDVAFGKFAKQSSTEAKFEAANALDASLTTCTKTKRESKPWWRVDLITSLNILSVRVFLCRGGAGLDTLEVLAGEKDAIGDINNKECKIRVGESASEFFCQQQFLSQYAFVRSTKEVALSIGKVQVIAAERVLTDNVCERKQVGGNGDLSEVKIPIRKLYSSTTIDHWYSADFTGNSYYKGVVVYNAYEVFGTRVYMSEIMEGLYQLKYNPADPRKKGYRLRVRTDTFYCDKEKQKDEKPFILHKFEKVEIIARKIVSDGCEIHFTQKNEETKKDTRKGNGASPGQPGYNGGRGLNGIDGLSARVSPIVVIISYIESEGKMLMIANGGDGADGTPGFKGGNGRQGEKGFEPFKPGTGSCDNYRGGPAKNGGNAGSGGKGGNGGNSGGGGQWIFLTPGNSKKDIQFDLKGCAGKPGASAKGGKPGKVGAAGERSQHYKGQSDRITSKDMNFCKYIPIGKGTKGRAGYPGKRGDDGVNGKAGNQGSYILKNLDKNMYDNEMADVILREADQLFMDRKKRDALKLYQIIYSFPQTGSSRKYSKLMIDRIKAGYNYYGYSDKFVMPIDIAESSAAVKSMLNLAKDREARIDKKLYRENVRNERIINYRSLTNALKENNNGIEKETKTTIKLWILQRKNVVRKISAIERKMRNTIEDMKRSLKAAGDRVFIDAVLNFIQIGASFIKPKLPDVEDVIEVIFESSKELADCGHSYDRVAMSKLMETAVQFSKFKGTTYDWGKLDLSQLQSQAAAELNKVITKDKIGGMQESFTCLFEHGAPGLELSGVIGTFLDFSLTRITAIAEVYRIDVKLAEFRIRLDRIKETNGNLDVIANDYEAKTAEVVLNKVAITEDLINTFEKTKKDVLTTLYHHTESLGFLTLWDFKMCMLLYTPNHFLNAKRLSYFDGYMPLEMLYKRIMDYKRNFLKTLRTNGAEEYGPRNFIFEFKDQDSKAIKDLREGKMAQIEIDATYFRNEKDTNVRLHSLYAELIFNDNKKPGIDYIFIDIEHLGDNHFYVDASDTKPTLVYQRISEKGIKSRVEDQQLKSCGQRNICHGKDTYPRGLIKDVCDVSSIITRAKRSTSRRLIKVPCGSPFATYQIKIPKSEADSLTTSSNPSSIDTSGIVGIRVLLGITFWKRYQPSKPGCPV